MFALQGLGKSPHPHLRLRTHAKFLKSEETIWMQKFRSLTRYVIFWRKLRVLLLMRVA